LHKSSPFSIYFAVIDSAGPSAVYQQLYLDRSYNLTCSDHVIGRPEVNSFHWIRKNKNLTLTLNTLTVSSTESDENNEQIKCLASRY